jgi:hypothetical protein
VHSSVHELKLQKQKVDLLSGCQQLTSLFLTNLKTFEVAEVRVLDYLTSELQGASNGSKTKKLGIFKVEF